MIGKSSLAVLLLLGLSQPSSLLAQESNAQESIVLDVGVLHEPKAGEYGVTELMIAAMYGDSGKVRELLEAGAKVDEVNDIGATAFMGAAYAGDLAVVEVLLEWNADVNHRDNKGDAVLGSVVWGRDARMAEVLLAHGADPNVAAYASETSILRHAAVTGQADIVDLLIEYDVDLESYGEPSLMAAASQGRTDIVRTLLNAGVAVSTARGYGGQTAVHMAAQYDHVDTINLLIERGADVNHLSSDGKTPLYAAIYKGYPRTVEVLLGAGANSSLEDLLLALQGKNGAVIDAVFDRFDIALLTAENLDRVLIAAELAEHPSVIEALLSSSSHLLQGNPARLLFAKQGGDECVISLWNPDNGDADRLVSFDSECPAQVFVADGNDALFIVEEGLLHIFSFDRHVPTRSVNLPVDQINTRLEELQTRLEAQVFEAYGDETSMKWMSALPAAVGLLDKGEIAVSISTRGPADGTYAYLYALRGSGKWSLVEEKGCHRFEWPCEFEQLNGRRVEYWPDPRKVWHPRARANEYFLSKVLREQHMQWDFGRPDVILFNIDEKNPLLAYSTGEEEHGDYLATSAVKYAVDESAPPDILCHTCETSLASRYLLIGEAFAKPCFLLDLGTGDSVFGALAFATWVD